MLTKMPNEKELRQINKNAILVHQLQPKDENSALFYFKTESIEKVSFCEEGLQIFFKEYDLVVKSLLRQKLEVNEFFYKIYPKVTNLTVIGVGPYVTNSEIENAMQYYGFVIDSYRIQEIMQERDCKTVSLSNDYRIILDVPEVLAPKLKPIKFPHIKNKTFDVLFFCRFCRNNGHMQFQCQKIAKSSSLSYTRHQSMEFFRSIPYESESLDLDINRESINCPQSDFCIDRRNSKFQSKFHAKTRKEQFQCKKLVKSSPPSYTCSQSTELHRRQSYESNPLDLIINRDSINCPQSDFCTDRKNSKFHSDSCAKTGKEQFQCKKLMKSSPLSSTCSQSMELHRRLSHENDSSDLVINRDSINFPQSGFCIDRKNSKFHSDSCARTGKEQFQCQKFVKNSSPSSTCPQSIEISRRIAFQNDSSDLITKKDSINYLQSVFCADQRNSKMCLDSHEKTEKKQSRLDQNSYSKNLSHNASVTYQSINVSNSCENNSRDSTINSESNNSFASDFSVDRKNSKTRLDSQVKTAKKQRYFPGENCSPKNSSHNSPSTCHQSTGISRKISCDTCSSDVSINNDEIENTSSDLCFRKNSKIVPNFHVKTEKEQDYSTDQIHNSAIKSYKSYVLKSSDPKSTHSKLKNRYNMPKHKDNVNMSKKLWRDEFSSMQIDDIEDCKGNNYSSFKEKSAKSLKRKRNLEKMKFNKDCDNDGATEMSQASASNECSDKHMHEDCNKTESKKKKFKVLSSLLPPNADLFKVKNLINTAFECKPKDIPTEVKLTLLGIKVYNRGKNVSAKGRKLLRWIGTVLNKIKQENVQFEKSYKDPINDSTKNQEQFKVSDGKSDVKISKQQSSRTRKISLSSGIIEAIFKTSGELDSTSMCQFLNQVRGRKKLLEVALAFTRNIPKLGSQLLDIQNTYYRWVQKRGREEDRDLSYINRLRKRLLQQNRNITGVALEDEKSRAEVPSEIESSMGEFSAKTESNIAEMFVKRESNVTEKSKTEMNMSEMFLKESDLTGISMKSESESTGVCVKSESDMAEMCVKESDGREMTIKTESDMIEVSVKSEAYKAEISVERGADIIMKQSSSNENYPYGASYFTNITQMPFSLTSIKNEVNN